MYSRIHIQIIIIFHNTYRYAHDVYMYTCIYMFIYGSSRLFLYPKTVSRHRPFGKGHDLGHGMACYGMPWQRMARNAMECYCMPHHGIAWRDKAWHDMPSGIGMATIPLPTNAWRMSCYGLGAKLLQRLKRDRAKYTYI